MNSKERLARIKKRLDSQVKLVEKTPDPKRPMPHDEITERLRIRHIGRFED